MLRAPIFSDNRDCNPGPLPPQRPEVTTAKHSPDEPSHNSNNHRRAAMALRAPVTPS